MLLAAHPFLDVHTALATPWPQVVFRPTRMQPYRDQIEVFLLGGPSFTVGVQAFTPATQIQASRAAARSPPNWPAPTCVHACTYTWRGCTRSPGGSPHAGRLAPTPTSVGGARSHSVWHAWRTAQSHTWWLCSPSACRLPRVVCCRPHPERCTSSPTPHTTHRARRCRPPWTLAMCRARSCSTSRCPCTTAGTWRWGRALVVVGLAAGGSK